MAIQANDVTLKSWVEVPAHSDFPIQNLPFGIFSDGGDGRVGVAIGDHVLDLSLLAEVGMFDDLDIPDLSVFYESTLNAFIGLGKATTSSVRNRISQLLQHGNATLSGHEIRQQALIDRKDLKMLMPVKVGDYTDFYSSKEHATNVGTMFRDPENALLPNWTHLPVAYHGRASSIIVSGVPIHRPHGQSKPPEAEQPVFGPTRRLDFELEMAFITGKSTELGTAISTADAEDYIFGFVMFNDWSARDIQAWEYVPLGPFLAKNFASSISPWVVTLDALEPFRIAGPVQDPPVLPYLQISGKRNFDIHLEAAIQPENTTATTVCRTNFRHMYWSINQQLAHHTVNGCNINIGDMYASGTISGSGEEAYGSMLELSWKGTKPLTMADGSDRSFIEDGDVVIFSGYAQHENIRIGFGDLKTKVLPAL